MDANKIEVKMTLAEFRQYEDAKRDAEQKLLELERMLVEATVNADSEGTVRRLLDAFDAGRKLVAFAIANCPPEAVKGWPVAALRQYADAVLSVPGQSIDNHEQARDWKIFANEAEIIERQREQRLQAPSVSSSITVEDVPVLE